MADNLIICKRLADFEHVIQGDGCVCGSHWHPVNDTLVQNARARTCITNLHELENPAVCLQNKTKIPSTTGASQEDKQDKTTDLRCPGSDLSGSGCKEKLPQLRAHREISPSTCQISPLDTRGIWNRRETY
jgi:hypothetical protein